MARPLVGDADWKLVYFDLDWEEDSGIPAKQVKVYQDRNNTIFYKVLTYIEYDHKTKYFYSETAHSDVPRYLVDKMGDSKHWNAFFSV